MSNKIASDAAIAKDNAIFGDEAQILGETGGDASKDQSIATPRIVIQRGRTFIQEERSWSKIPEDGTPFIKLEGTRFEQYFRFKNARLQCAGLTANFTSGPPTDDTKWFDVKGYPGLMIVTGIDGKVTKYFTIENATAEIWPSIRVATYSGRMELHKGKNAIFVASPGKLIHRITGKNGEDLTGYPSYVCGCVIPGIYDDAVDVDDVRSVRRPGEALDAIIESLGGFQTKTKFTITVK